MTVLAEYPLQEAKDILRILQYTKAVKIKSSPKLDIYGNYAY